MNAYSHRDIESISRKQLRALYASKGVVLGPPVEPAAPPAPAAPPDACTDCGAAIQAGDVICRYCRMKLVSGRAKYDC